MTIDKEFKELPENYSKSKIVDMQAFLLSNGDILSKFVSILALLKEAIISLQTVKSLSDLRAVMKVTCNLSSIRSMKPAYRQ